MNNFILEAHNVHKSYPAGREKIDILKGIDLEITSGQMLMLIGPSGAGKSTLLHILGGLENPTEGKVIIDGINLYEANDTRRASLRNESIGFVFQFYHLLPEFTALENVLLPAVINNKRRIRRKELIDRANSLLDDVGLSHRVSHRPGELSGGEQQRVAVARALMNEPKLILCDEPTGNLDSENSKKLMSLLEKMNQENKQTFMIVSHDEELSRMAHRIIRIKDGKFIE